MLAVSLGPASSEKSERRSEHHKAKKWHLHYAGDSEKGKEPTERPKHRDLALKACAWYALSNNYRSRRTEMRFRHVASENVV